LDPAIAGERVVTITDVDTQAARTAQTDGVAGG
jgi:hypothetical protein